MGMEHLGKEKNDVLGRVNSMCVDPEVKERVWHIRITERNPEGVGLLPLSLVPTLARNKMTPKWELAKL